MVLMRRLLLEAQAKFRKMMSDNQALASRIDQDIQSAHLQVSALRAELADTNQRLSDIRLQSTGDPAAAMAGNVITTCMPPTATTNSQAVSSQAEDRQWKQGAPAVVTCESSCRAPPIADKGGTGGEEPKPDAGKPVVNGSPTGKKSGIPKPVSDAKPVGEEESPDSKAKEAQGSPFSSPRSGKEAREKAESLTESSEASEDAPAATRQRGHHHRRERRSLKGSDVQKSLLNDLKLQAEPPDDPKGDLQRSESDGTQNSAPECDLSLGGSPFKEDAAARAGDPKRGDIDPHRNSPPVKDDSNARCFSFSKHHPAEGQRCPKAKTNSDPLDKRREGRAAGQEHDVLSSPSCVARQKAAARLQLGWEDRRPPEGPPWYQPPDAARSLEETSSRNETPELCDRGDHGRYVVFDSRRAQHRQWRTSFGEQVVTDAAWKAEGSGKEAAASACKFRDEREVPEKDDQRPAQASSYFRKPLTTDFPAYGSKDLECQDADVLRIRNAALVRDLEDVMESRDEKAKENAALAARLDQAEKELKVAREALVALKQDRKRLKAEKFDLLTQMKQLYGTLEDKEEELREFIRNYEQKVKESDDNLKQMAKEREEMEQEKWTILKRARDESERAVLLCTQLGLKDAQIKELQDELGMLQEKLKCSGGGAALPSNGFGSPGSVSYRTANGGPETPTPTEPATSPSFAGTPTLGQHQYLPAAACSPFKSTAGSSSSPEHRPSLLSRSAEDIFDPVLGPGFGGKKKHHQKEKKGTWGSISRVFSRSKKRKPLDPELFENNRASWSPKESSICSSPLSEESYVQKLRLLEETHGTPMQHWRAATVLAWLEITMDMPQYGALCAENIKSGKVLLELSESELEEGLGISNVMHRRKLRLAIEEHRQPSLCRYPKICLMTHSWVVEEWLPSIALMCYLPSFSEHLVDGRVLDTLTKKDLEKHFGITRKFHQLSILHGIQLLRMLNFDRQILNQRRMNCENMDIDPLVWTNQRLIKWAQSIDLGEYAENLRNTGVHGALAVLEPSFTADTIATALGIPTSKNIIRRHLTTEWQNLIQPARLSLESESVVAKKSKSEKRLASGSSSTSLVSQGRSSSGIMPSYARRTLDRYDRRRSSWRFSTWRSSQESLKSTASKKALPNTTAVAERPQVLPLSPKLNSSRHRRTFSSHSDVETLTVTPV